MAMNHKVVKVDDGTLYAIEVSEVGKSGKWELVVYKLPEKTVMTQDFFGERTIAMSRAYDFKGILEKQIATSKEAAKSQAS